MNARDVFQARVEQEPRTECIEQFFADEATVFRVADITEGDYIHSFLADDLQSHSKIIAEDGYEFWVVINL